jgi:uncharacterized DUF497 family protein
MKYYDWDTEKNERLKTERGISFEDIAFYIHQGFEVDVFEHPNQSKYPGEYVSVVLVDEYAYLVPYVESDSTVFLKTIIPSRKATKMYIGESDG